MWNDRRQTLNVVSKTQLNRNAFNGSSCDSRRPSASNVIWTMRIHIHQGDLSIVTVASKQHGR